MTTTVTLEEAAANLEQLIDGLAYGEEVMITKDQRIVAKLIGQQVRKGEIAPPGFGKGSILYMAPDFDAPMDEFKDYM